jgi:hypothetical protein
MGYMHIDNLYKNTEILLFKQCYALEKIHGTSANIHYKYNDNKILYHSGGEKHEKFIKLFNHDKLLNKFKEIFVRDVIIYGEAYGGKCQGMSETYGKELKFIVFDVKIGDNWINVPNAEDVALKLGLEFVDYTAINTNIEEINAERDKDSTQAIRNECGAGKLREGVVLRPLIELTKNNGERIIVKHKRDEFLETATKREVSPEQLKILEDAKAIANEWVTSMRLSHVLDKIGNPTEIESTGKVITAMIEDVYREAEGEIIKSPSVKKSIGKLTAQLYKNKISKI